MATGNRSLTDGSVRMLRRMKQYLFDITWQDVQYVLASFPKSGRTWLRFQICSYLNYYYDLGVDLDLNTMFSIITNDGRDKLRGFDVYGFKRDKRVPIITSTHAYGTCGYLKGKPVIMLVRDPKDAFLSASYPGRQNKQSPSFMQTLKVNRRKGALRFALFMNTWADQLTRTPHTILSYEQMKRDTPGCLKRVIELINVPVDDAIIAKAVENASLENMRRLNQERGLGNSGNIPEGTRLRVNKGAAGRGKKELNARVRDFIDELLRNALTDEAKQVLSATTDMTLTRIEMTQRPARSPRAQPDAAPAAVEDTASIPKSKGKPERRTKAQAPSFKKRSQLQAFSRAALGEQTTEHLSRPGAPKKKDFWRHVDAAIVSYPGSGREPWRRLIASYVNNAYGLGLSMDRRAAMQVIPNEQMDPACGLPAYRWFDRADVPLMAASQRPFSQHAFARCSVVFLVRPPASWLVDRAARTVVERKPPADDAMPSWRDEVARYAEFMNAWAVRLEQPDSLVVSVDEVQTDPQGSMERLVEFLKLPYSETSLRVAAAQCKRAKHKASKHIAGATTTASDSEVMHVLDELLSAHARRVLEAAGALGEAPGSLIRKEIQATSTEA